MTTAAFEMCGATRSDDVRYQDDLGGASQPDSAPAGLLPEVGERVRTQTSEAGLECGERRVQGFEEESVDRSHTRIEPPQGAQVPVRPFVDMASGRSPQRRFKLLQAWEGVVTDVSPDGVWADLVDLTDRDRPTEVVEFSPDEVSPADLPLVVPGGVFYWTIGYDTSPGGSVRLVSEIRLRRTPVWTASELDAVRARGRDLLREMQGDVEDRSAAK